MLLDFAILAENAAYLKDERFALFGAPSDAYSVSELPAVIMLNLAARIFGDDGEQLEDHSIALDVVNPAGERKAIGETRGLALAPGRGGSLRPSASLLMKFAMQFLSEGVYSFHLKLDGIEVKVLKVVITKSASTEADSVEEENSGS